MIELKLLHQNNITKCGTWKYAVLVNSYTNTLQANNWSEVGYQKRLGYWNIYLSYIICLWPPSMKAVGVATCTFSYLYSQFSLRSIWIHSQSLKIAKYYYQEYIILLLLHMVWNLMTMTKTIAANETDHFTPHSGMLCNRQKLMTVIGVKYYNNIT
jgi:hypothetical protein